MAASGNYQRCEEAVLNHYGRVSGQAIIEQYVFGWTRTYIMVTTSLQQNPFHVLEFNNIKTLKFREKFESRVEAFNWLSKTWLAQFTKL